MSKIEGVRIRNFKALKDVTLGKLWNNQSAEALTPLTVVIGKNGAGKSSLFDAFGFLADCLKVGVEEACDLNKRGGFDRIRTKDVTDPVSFEIYFRETPGERPITYEVSFDVDENGHPFVLSERLRQRRLGQKSGWPFSFLMLDGGKGIAWRGDAVGYEEKSKKYGQLQLLFEDLQKKESESNVTEWVELEDNRKLGIATLGALKQHTRISMFRKFMEGWYLSYFTPDAARSLPLSGAQKLLNIHGDNMGNVVQYMRRDCPKQFDEILRRIAERIPGITKIDTEETNDKRVLLQFYAEGFDKPFYAQQMSDGTLKIFAYLLLLSTPERLPFLCVEEPENGLYHKLLATLVKEFRELATGKKDSPQIFVTTHQPYLVDNLDPNEVWILTKGKDGYSTVRRASDDKLVSSMVAEGLPLGGLWFSDYLEKDL